MDELKKRDLMETIAHCLDITPNMFQMAQRVVKGVSNFISNNSGADIYTQGSLKLGTIIKPYLRDKRGDYDIDLVVQYADNKNTISPKEIKQRLGELLKSSQYATFLVDEGRRCWTLNYFQSNGTNTTFHIDLLPCVDESNSIKNTIFPKQFKNTAVSITNIKNKDIKPYNYDWKSSNPKGFAIWFDTVNNGKYKSYKFNDRNRIYENNKLLFESVELVEDDYTRSPLQMVIQILKRHRDVMFTKQKITDFKPISIIITTLVGKIVEENDIVDNNTYSLLNTVLEGLDYYANLQSNDISSDFSEEFKYKRLIVKRYGDDGKPYWIINSPADSNDNLANKWNENPKFPAEFFRWVKQVKADLIDILDFAPQEIIAKISCCLGEDVAKVIRNFDFAVMSKPRPVVSSITKPKPYKNYERL